MNALKLLALQARFVYSSLQEVGGQGIQNLLIYLNVIYSWIFSGDSMTSYILLTS